MIIYIVVDFTDSYNIACFDSLEKAKIMVADYKRMYPYRTYTIEIHEVK